MSLFIGRIPRDMRSRDLEDTFSKFGKITRFDIKQNQGFGFIEFEDKRDAEDAMKEAKGAEYVVEWARNGGHRPGGSECFHCGEQGHWARDCSKAPPRERRSNGYNRRDNGRGYDRDRRFNRDDYDRRRDDRGREDRGRDRSPRRNEYRDRHSDRRDADRRDDNRREDNRRDDRREKRDREERRHEDDRQRD